VDHLRNSTYFDERLRICVPLSKEEQSKLRHHLNPRGDDTYRMELEELHSKIPIAALLEQVHKFTVSKIAFIDKLFLEQ